MRRSSCSGRGISEATPSKCHGHRDSAFYPLADTLPRVAAGIRAAGLAAESLVYNETFEHLMGDPAVRRSIKADTDNAKRDLVAAQLLFSSSSDAEFVHWWRMGFDDAVCLLRSSQDNLQRIADYCLMNQDRDIPGRGACRQLQSLNFPEASFRCTRRPNGGTCSPDVFA